MEKKLKSIGINSPLELQKIIGGILDLSYKIWRGEARLTVDRALKIKEVKKVSLDWLFADLEEKT